MTYRALIVDDERLARVALRRLLDARDDVEVVGEASSIDSAIEHVVGTCPDVIFLDIQLPGENGFELFERADINAQVVFVTAFDEFALRAFEVNAIDYLVKPVTPEQLARALSRLTHDRRKGTSWQEGAGQLTRDDVVCLPEAQRMTFTPVSDIVSIRAAGDYTEVHLASNKSALVNVTLRKWEQRLPENVFVRIHRSTLVNLGYIDEVANEHGRWSVLLRVGNDPLPMSRRYALDIRRRLEIGS